jgi:hypothetical protein
MYDYCGAQGAPLANKGTMACMTSEKYGRIILPSVCVARDGMAGRHKIG